MVHRRTGSAPGYFVNVTKFLERSRSLHSRATGLCRQKSNDIKDTMQILNWITGRRAEKKVVMALFCLVLLSVFAQAAATAQQQTSPRFEAAGLNKPAQDITITGSVEQLITTRTPGAPAGLLLTVNGPQGILTASLGSSLSREAQQALTQGAPVTVTGLMETFNGRSYLAARTITAGGSQITLRNEHGFAVHSQARSRASATNTDLSRGAK